MGNQERTVNSRFQRLLNPVIVDLQWDPNWKKNAKKSGRVSDVLDPSLISKIVFIHVLSNAPLDYLAEYIVRAISNTSEFIEMDRYLDDFWLQAVIETNDGARHLTQLSHEFGRLTSESYHGYFTLDR